MAHCMRALFLGFFLIIFTLTLVNAIYEDQAGTFDWRQQYVGKALFTEYIQGTQRIIVGTEQNVIAAINGKNGQLGWRHLLEKGASGRIDAMQVQSSHVVTVLADGEHVRCLNVISGSLLWEISIPTTSPAHRARLHLFTNPSGRGAVLTHDRLTVLNLESGDEEWAFALSDSELVEYTHVTQVGGALYIVGTTAGSHVKVTSLASEDGKEQWSRLVPAAWITADNKCAAGKDGHFVCVDKQTGAIQVLELTGGTVFTSLLVQDTKVIYEKAHFVPIHVNDDSIHPSYVVLRVNNRDHLVLTLDKGVAKLARSLPDVSAVQVFGRDEKLTLVTLSRTKQNDIIAINGYDLSTNSSISDLTRTVPYPAHHGHPQEMYGALTKLKDGSTGFHMLTLAEDHSITMFQNTGKVLWVREEALASILSVDMVDLPVSQIMAKMEDEFGSRDDIFHLFLKRFRTQLSQLVTFALQLKQKLRMVRHQASGSSSASRGVNDFTVESEVGAATEEDEEGVDEDYLTRDDFNLHKIIVVVTAPGKIFGLDSHNGRSIWKKYLQNVEPFRKQGRDALPLFVQRTTAHFPHQPLCTVFGRDMITKQAVLYSFHPITGAPVENMPSGGEVLNYNVISAVMMSQMDEQFLHPMILLDDKHQYHVYPESDTGLVREISSSLFSFIADVDTGLLSGYSVDASKDNRLSAMPLWTVDLNKNIQRITKVVSKPVHEHVHSQGIVLDDRSVLYKYINPNLIAVVAEGDDPVQKGAFFSIYLVDTVTGNLVFHCTHKKSKGPINLIHSENWVSYNYWSQKHRRTELAVLELYEGSRQSNATAFSSFHPPPPPIVMRQAYIFPSFISAMSTTVTEKGITSKEVIFALETGGILSLPKLLIDPRRPEVMSHEPREEGSQIMVPYMPELPRPPQSIINYHQTVFNIRGIHTAPAGLESTSLVLCYGLDIFYTRVTPSKMFDVLKEDFDYFFISSVLIGMIAVSIISQKLATRKALNRAWK